MRDRSRKKTATISTTTSAVASRKMKKSKAMETPEISQVVAEKEMMVRKKPACNPCDPLSYIVNRQINDKFDHCKSLVDARFLNAQNLFRKDLYSHFGCINAIEFSKQGDLLISGGDDKRVLLWNVQKAIQGQGEPTVMKAQHSSNIFCMGYNSSNTKIFSAGNDDQVIVHDLETTRTLDIFRHEKPVYGLSPHPHDDNIFASACDDGRVLVYDMRGNENSESYICVAEYKDPFHSVRFNPVNPYMLATANTKEGISMWDIRKPLWPVLRYGSQGVSCMSVCFNAEGKTLLALRRRLPPVLYAVNSSKHLFQFDHPGYYNSCTMKSCCFTGSNDEYIMSGSDDFNLYMWKIPTDDTVDWVDSAHMVLRGHRSIVNQVRYNPASCILASSGVEKIIKIWSPFQLSGSYSAGGLGKDDDNGETQRRVYTHDEYIGLVLRSGQLMTHDYSHQSVNEDQRMMAFFDSLVQREIENWSSEDPPTPESLTEPDNNNTSDFISSDTDDSSMSDRQIMRCFFPCSTLNTRPTTNASERPFESPNRITRLIANRRDKLMRLANLDGQPQPKKNTRLFLVNSNSTTSIAEPSTVGNRASNEVESSYATRSKAKMNKTNSRSDVGFKRKYILNRKNRARRKLVTVKDDSDSDSDLSDSFDSNDKKELIKADNEIIRQQQVVESAPQPSTSSGVISSGHFTSAMTSKTRTRKSLSCSSNSSSVSDSEEDVNRRINFRRSNAEKRKSTMTDSDSSAKETEPQKQKALRNKSKTTPYSRRVKSKRQKINNDIANCNNHVKKEISVTQNGSTNATETTPLKNLKHLTNSDSGITSGISTTEKSGTSTAEKLNSRLNRGESSDREKVSKNYEWFKKRIDIARRGYRKRATLPPPSSSDSSDD